jgi:type VI secretion system protein ImpK
MTPLWEYFADCFSYTLLCEDRLGLGDQPTYEAVRTTCQTLLQQQRARAAEQGRDDEFWQAAFAVVAWIDEMLQKARTHDHRPWEHAERWSHFPLQHETFSIADAGEEFFPRLESLPPTQGDIREVYYLCIALGYTGPYAADKLRTIRQELAEQLPCKLEDLRQAKHFMPQPYDARHFREVKPPRRRWARALLPALGLCCLALVAAWILHRPAPPDGSQIVEILRGERLLECANVSAQTQLQSREATLRGRVRDHEQGRAIRDRVQAMPGVAMVTDTFEMVPRPFCQALDLVEPLLNRDSGFAVEAVPPLTVGRNLVIRGRTPPFASYVYVLYFNINHGVWQMWPHGWDAQSSHPFAPASSYTIGGGNSVTWEIARPVGRELVIVLASKTPLPQLSPTQKPDTPEPITTLLPKLGNALRDKNKEDVAVVYTLIETQDAPNDHSPST